MNSKSLVIVGQTASGKSGLAMRVSQDYGGEIIAADSRTVYKGLSIGTAKPSVEDMSRVPHHLVDIADPESPYSVADFQRDARAAIEDILGRGKLPVVVGGSGLYIDSLLYDYELGGEADMKQRQVLESMSIDELQQQIHDKGYQMPENKENKRYLVRVLERGNAPANREAVNSGFYVVGLRLDKDALEQRIRLRLDQMLKEGLLGEVEQALQTYPPESEALKGNIYRVLRPYFEGEKDLKDCLEDFVISDLRLAKKQMSWFKRNPAIHWFSSADEAYEHLKALL